MAWKCFLDQALLFQVSMLPSVGCVEHRGPLLPKVPRAYAHIRYFFPLFCLILSILERQLYIVEIFTYSCLTLP